MIDVAFPPVVVWERGVLHGERFAGPKTFALEPVPQRMQAGWRQPDRPSRATRPTPDGSHRRRMARSNWLITGNNHRNVGSMQAQIARQLLIASKDDRMG